MTKLLLGVPVFASVYPKPFESFLTMAVSAGSSLHGKAQVSVRVHPRDALVSAMNTYGKLVIEHGFDALIVADDDCLFPPHAIAKLVSHYEAGRDFVAGVGFMRGFPHTTTIGRYLPEGRSMIRTPHGVEWRGFQWLDDITGAPELIKADFCGVPIAMISRRAFEQTEQPWFGTQLEDGSVTHDVFFAHRLQKAGIPVLVDTTLVCGHLADPAVIDPTSRQIARQVWDTMQKPAEAVAV